jgi:hypothetical protein
VSTVQAAGNLLRAIIDLHDMDATRTDNTRPATIAEPIYLENTLLRVFGVLFCHDAKSARSGAIAINRGVKEKNISVRIDPEYAQPGPFAHRVAMAVIRKQSSYGRPAQRQISFSQRELVRLSGRKSWGGRQSEQLGLALKQIRYAHVLAHFRVADRFVEHDFSIFNEVMLERRSSPTDPIVACTIVLADPIIQSLNDKHFTCLNHILMQRPAKPHSQESIKLIKFIKLPQVRIGEKSLCHRGCCGVALQMPSGRSRTRLRCGLRKLRGFAGGVWRSARGPMCRGSGQWR